MPAQNMPVFSPHFNPAILSSPPAEVQQRAWEASYVLGDEFRPQVAPVDLWRIDAAFRAGPYRQSWYAVCAMFVLLGRVVEARR